MKQITYGINSNIDRTYVAIITLITIKLSKITIILLSLYHIYSTILIINNWVLVSYYNLLIEHFLRYIKKYLLNFM